VANNRGITRSGGSPTSSIASYFFNMLKSLFSNSGARTTKPFQPSVPTGVPSAPAQRRLPAYHTVIENIRRKAFGQREILPQKPFLQGGLYRPDPSETMNNIRRALGQKAPPQKPLLWGGTGYKPPRLGSYLPGMIKAPPSGVMPMSSQAKPATKSLNKKSSVLLKRAAAYGSVTRYLGHRKSASYDELVSYVRVCRTAQRILKAAEGVLR